MGWQDEQTMLATQRGPALVGYAYLLCGDLTRAHDLVQEALVRAWARPGLARGPQATEAYVRRALLNVFLDERRRATSGHAGATSPRPVGRAGPQRPYR